MEKDLRLSFGQTNYQDLLNNLDDKEKSKKINDNEANVVDMEDHRKRRAG